MLYCLLNYIHGHRVWKALGKKCVHLARFSSTFLTLSLSLSLCPSLVNVCFVFLFHYILNDSVDWQFQLTIGTVGYGNNMLRSHFAVRISCFFFSLAHSLFIPTLWHEMPHSIFMFCWCHYWNGIISGHQCLSWLDHIALTFLHDGYWPLNFHALRILKSKPFFLILCPRVPRIPFSRCYWWWCFFVLFPRVFS